MALIDVDGLTFSYPGANVLLLMHTRGLFFQAEPVREVAGGRVVFVYSGDVRRLARHPHLARFRYGVP